MKKGVKIIEEEYFKWDQQRQVKYVSTYYYL